MKRQENELILDDLYNSRDPAVKRFMNQALMEEMNAAQERATIRTAQKFSHLLPPHMRQVLAAQYPVPALAASA